MPDLETLEPGVAEIERFVRRFSPGHLELATLCALPLVLTPDLVGFIRSRYLRRQAPWVAEADLLLSELCREAGYEQYTMLPAVRTRLIRRAKAVWPELVEPVAQSLVSYVRQLERKNPWLDRRFTQVQQWAALAYLDDKRADVVADIARNLRAALEAGGEGSRESLARLNQLTQLTESLATELRDSPDLLEYAAEVRRSLVGTGLAPSTSGQTTVVGGVSLPNLGTPTAAELGALHGGMASERRQGNILWVTDDVEKYAYEMAYVRALGYAVTEAGTTDAAVHLMKDHSFEIIVSDVSRRKARDDWEKLLNRLPRRWLGRFFVYSTTSTRSYREAQRHQDVTGATNDWNEFLKLLLAEQAPATEATSMFPELCEIVVAGRKPVFSLGVAIYFSPSDSTTYAFSGQMSVGPKEQVHVRVPGTNLEHRAEWVGTDSVSKLSVFRFQGDLPPARPYQGDALTGHEVTVPDMSGKAPSPKNMWLEKHRGLWLTGSGRRNLPPGTPVYDRATTRLIGIAMSESGNVRVAPLADAVSPWLEAPNEFRRSVGLPEVDEALDFIVPLRWGSPTSSAGTCGFVVGWEDGVNYVVTARHAVFNDDLKAVELASLYVNGVSPVRVWHGEDGRLDIAVLAVPGEPWPSVALASDAAVQQNVLLGARLEGDVQTSPFEIEAKHVVNTIQHGKGPVRTEGLLRLRAKGAPRPLSGFSGGPALIGDREFAAGVLVAGDSEGKEAFATEIWQLPRIWSQMPLEMAVRLGAPATPDHEIAENLAILLARDLPKALELRLVLPSSPSPVPCELLRGEVGDGRAHLMFRYLAKEHALVIEAPSKEVEVRFDGRLIRNAKIWIRQIPDSSRPDRIELATGPFELGEGPGWLVVRSSV